MPNDIRVTLPFNSVRILLFFWRHICWRIHLIRSSVYLAHIVGHFLSATLPYRNSLPQQADYHPRYWRSSKDGETNPQTFVQK